MVISHCGAGILLESLRAETHPIIIAVVNVTLMNNHQAELADQLENDNHVHKAEPATVIDKLRQLANRGGDQQSLVKYPPRTEGLLVGIIDEMLL